MKARSCKVKCYDIPEEFRRHIRSHCVGQYITNMLPHFDRHSDGIYASMRHVDLVIFDSPMDRGWLWRVYNLKLPTNREV